MDNMLKALLLLSSCVFVAYSASVESSLDLLLREIEDLEVYDREAQVTKRVNDVMTLLSAPLERNYLLERGVEGTMCDDGIKTSCHASVTCSDEGTQSCNPLCDSYDHGKVAHFYCRCKNGYTAQLCDVTDADAEQKCKECKQQGGMLCYKSQGSEEGFFCYDNDYKTMSVSKRGLEVMESEEGDRLGRIARVLHAYIRENL